MISVTLPWPPRALWPNARGHWSRKAKAARQYREDASLLCIVHRVPRYPQLVYPGNTSITPHISVQITFHPPDRRARDIDNMLAAIKAGIDGIAERINVDDQHWSMTIGRGEVRKGGAVVVEIGT